MTVLAVALLLAAAPANEPVARIDGFAVTGPALQARLATSQAAPADVLQDLLNEAAMAADAERLGYAKDPRVLAAVDRERRRLAGDDYLARALQGIEEVDESALRSIFHDQADGVRLRMVVVASADDAAKLRERLAAGADVAAEAKRSLDPAWQAGTPQWRTRGQLEPAMQQAAFGARLKEWTGPVVLGLGVAVLQVVERAVGTEQEFAERREALGRFATEQLRGHTRQQLIARLRREAGATIDEPFVRSTEKRLDATPGEAAHVVARVRGKPIAYGELLPDIQRLARGKEGGHFSGTSVKMEVISRAVDRRVVEEAALAEGAPPAAETTAALGALRRDEMVRAYAADLRAKAGKPSAKEIEGYYRQNQTQFQRSGSRTCSHVMARSKDLADVALKRLRNGQPFDDVARDLSADGASAARGGLLGDITDEQLATFAKEEPDLGAAIRGARPGQVAGPVKSRSGWHVLQCTAYRAPAPVPLAEVSEAIARRLEQERGDDAVRSRIGELRARARISIDEAALQRAAEHRQQ